MPTIDQCQESAGDASQSPAEQLLTAPSENIRVRSVRGGAVTFAAQAVKFVLNVGSTMVLARMLTPTDYGLVGMVASVTALVQLLKDGGLDIATIQRTHLTHQQVSNLFWVNVAISLILTVILVAVSPLIAFLFHDQRLVWITIAHAGMLIFSGIAIQHQALLRRQMSFTLLAIIDIASQLVGIGVGIGMAVAGFGYWALVGMSAAMLISSAAGVWLALPWVPGLPRRGHSVRSMLSFGGNIVGFNLLNYFQRNADSVLIGWSWGPSALGIYQRAYQLLLLPINQINNPLGSVAVSAFSRVQQQPERLWQYFLGGVSTVISLSLPIVLSLTIFAEEIIMLLLGPQWRSAVPIFRCLAIAALVGAAGHPTGWLLIAIGRTDRYFRMAMVTSPLVVIGFIAGLAFGPQGVATAYSIVCALAVIPVFAYAIRGTGVTLADVARAVWHPILAALVASVVALAFKWAFQASLSAILLALAGCSVYFGIYALVLLVALGQWRYYRRLFRGFLGK